MNILTFQKNRQRLESEAVARFRDNIKPELEKLINDYEKAVCDDILTKEQRLEAMARGQAIVHGGIIETICTLDPRITKAEALEASQSGLALLWMVPGYDD